MPSGLLPSFQDTQAKTIGTTTLTYHEYHADHSHSVRNDDCHGVPAKTKRSPGWKAICFSLGRTTSRSSLLHTRLGIPIAIRHSRGNSIGLTPRVDTLNNGTVPPGSHTVLYLASPPYLASSPFQMNTRTSRLCLNSALRGRTKVRKLNSRLSRQNEAGRIGYR